jgi:ATP-binding cassette subfamily B protein
VPDTPGRAAERRATAARVLNYLRPYRGRATIAVLLTPLETALAMVPIVALKVLIDRLTAPDPVFSDFLFPVAISVGAVAAGALVAVAVGYLAQSITEGVVFDLRGQLFAQLLRHGTAFYTRSRGGDLLSRVLNDVAAVETTLSETLLAFIRATLMTVATVGLMFVLEWRLALLCLALFPAVLIPTRRAARRLAHANRKVQEQLSVVTTYLQETLGLSGVLLVRVFGRQRVEAERFGELNAELRQRKIAAGMIARWFEARLSTMIWIGPVLILLAGGYLVAKQAISVGTVIVFATVVVARLGSAVQSLAVSVASALGTRPVWRRIFETLDSPPEVFEHPGARPLADVHGSVRLEEVSFTYPGQDRPAVQDVSLEIGPGQLLALVGPSGAGKTTLSALIARLLDPTAGRVLLDGHDLRELTLESVSDAIGLVFQDTFLFHASLAENLRYGRPEATQEELAAAVRDANLEEVVASLPDGYDTLVGERGHRLSGGEKQRVAIARTIIKDPRVLVLDEATSHLDSASELLVQAGLQRLMPGRTSVVIAHRLSTVVRADLVAVLREGQVVQLGSHSELLVADGPYAEMFALQSAGLGPNVE